MADPGALKQQISDSIRRCLPTVSEQKARDLAEHLHEMDLVRIDQLQFVKEEDVREHLSAFEARQLIAFWNSSGSSDNDKENRDPTFEKRPGQDWDFKINWKDIYSINSKMKQRMKAGKKLRVREKRELIKRVVQQVRDRVPHAQRDIFDQIAFEMKSKYKVTFRSELAKGAVAKQTLGYKMKTKFDNDKRPVSRRSATESEAPSFKVAHGCRKWRAIRLPQGESAESLETTRQELEIYFESQRPSAWDWQFINAAMTKTYGQQRVEINKQAEAIIKQQKQLLKQKKQKKGADAGAEQALEEDIDNPDAGVFTSLQIRDRWPFLFTHSGMMMHFTMLTEENLEEKFEEYLDQGLDDMVDFLSNTNKEKKKKSVMKKMKEAEEKLGNDSYVPKFGGCLLLLLQRFKEKKESLWSRVDEHTTEEEIPNEVNLPPYPFLVFKGDTIFTEDQVYFSMDGHILGSAKGLIEGVQMVFAAYYVFNLLYAPEAQVTLEFIQRCVLILNPPRGNRRPDKASGGHHSSRQTHHFLTQLNTKYDEYMAEKASSGEESPEDKEEVD